MSLVLRTIEGLPRGRTTEDLLALLSADFDPRRRASIVAELGALSDQGLIRRGRDGLWRAAARRTPEPSGPSGAGETGIAGDRLHAVPGDFLPRQTGEGAEAVAGRQDNADPAALVRYYRAALRADPRGAIAEMEDRHGTSWQLLTGTGPITPAEGEDVVVTVPLEALPADFRQALAKRRANERTLALGWPLHVTRRSGVRSVLPVGLIPAEWERTERALHLTVTADDVQANPEWIRAASRSLGWRESDLRELFAGVGGMGLPFAEFRARLREAAASALHGPLVATEMAAALDLEAGGIQDICGLFLPTDTTFTAGAVRDLDRIGAWTAETLRETALGALFGAGGEQAEHTAINPGPLNAEQLDAVRHACRAPLTVVTGPPGTGKSQAIVAMAASVLNDGGSVLVASRNHQALDAVETRLGEIAPKAPFLVRTLDPAREIDMSFDAALQDLVEGPGAGAPEVDDVAVEALNDQAQARDAALDAHRRHARLRLELAELTERIEARRRAATPPPGAAPPSAARRRGWLRRVVAWLSGPLRPRPASSPALAEAAGEHGAPLATLEARATEIRAEIAALDLSGDPVARTEATSELARKVLAARLARRAAVPEERRQALGQARADRELAGETGAMDRALAGEVLAHRPLWLASVLGTPKRIPLHAGLFDLVIFDEASQCDIASALPLLARARRAVIVGDDRQLSFIPQIGVAQDRNLMQTQGLAPAGMGRFAQSRRSLFDLADLTPGAARVMLRDQYRSAPRVVDYISHQFYGGRLRPAADTARMKAPAAVRPGLAWTNVAAPGAPQNGNVNPAETKAIVAHLETLLIAEGYDGSVGVITPFRPQAAAIDETVRASLPAQVLERCAFRAGTVDSFQGQERDLILFSPCLGPASAASAVQFVQRDWRRLNVAISRARAVAHVFGDLNFARSGKVTSLARLAAWATEPGPTTSEGLFDSDWERRVHAALKARGLEPVPQYEIAGRRLDFALFGAGGVKLDLEVDGRRWHLDIDGNRKSSDLWRDHQLKSLGWRVRRFWVDELSRDMEGCLDLVERDLA